MVYFKIGLRNASDLLLGGMLLIFGALAYGCHDKEPELPTPIVTPIVTHTPTLLDSVIGQHTGGHCTYRSEDVSLHVVLVDTTFDDGVIEITRVNDRLVRAEGYGWTDIAPFPMPVESTDTIFYGQGHTTAFSFGIKIDLVNRTISTGEGRFYPTSPIQSRWTGLWKF